MSKPSEASQASPKPVIKLNSTVKQNRSITINAPSPSDKVTFADESLDQPQIATNDLQVQLDSMFQTPTETTFRRESDGQSSLVCEYPEPAEPLPLELATYFCAPPVEDVEIRRSISRSRRSSASSVSSWANSLDLDHLDDDTHQHSDTTKGTSLYPESSPTKSEHSPTERRPTITHEDTWRHFPDEDVPLTEHQMSLIRNRVWRSRIGTPSSADKKLLAQRVKNFDATVQPSKANLFEASVCMVRDEKGNLIRFGNLFEGQATCVCFIRHFWCSQCQDYLVSIVNIPPADLHARNMKLIVVSNGSWKLIKSYRKVLGLAADWPPIYTDKSKTLYHALGMTKRTMDAGKANEVGDYIQHSLGGSVGVGIVRGMRMRIGQPGDQKQLGGEFVLGPGLNCSFAHRMTNTRNHAEIRDILAACDRQFFPIDTDQASTQRAESERSPTPPVVRPFIPNTPPCLPSINNSAFSMGSQLDKIGHSDTWRLSGLSMITVDSSHEEDDEDGDDTATEVTSSPSSPIISHAAISKTPVMAVLVNFPSVPTPTNTPQTAPNQLPGIVIPPRASSQKSEVSSSSTLSRSSSKSSVASTITVSAAAVALFRKSTKKSTSPGPVSARSPPPRSPLGLSPPVIPAEKKSWIRRFSESDVKPGEEVDIETEIDPGLSSRWSSFSSDGSAEGQRQGLGLTSITQAWKTSKRGTWQAGKRPISSALSVSLSANSRSTVSPI